MGAMKALYTELHERLEHMSPKLLTICIEKARVRIRNHGFRHDVRWLRLVHKLRRKRAENG